MLRRSAPHDERNRVHPGAGRPVAVERSGIPPAAAVTALGETTVVATSRSANARPRAGDTPGHRVDLLGTHRHVADELAATLKSWTESAPRPLGDPYGPKARWRKAAIWPRVTSRFGQYVVGVQPEVIPAAATRLMLFS